MSGRTVEESVVVEEEEEDETVVDVSDDDDSEEGGGGEGLVPPNQPLFSCGAVFFNPFVPVTKFPSLLSAPVVSISIVTGLTGVLMVSLICGSSHFQHRLDVG